jgi:CheY-like chemotaxis protein
VFLKIAPACGGRGVLIATILIVEDDVFIRELAVLMIDDLGHKTLSASGMEEAFGALRLPEHIDLLFTDIRISTAALGGFEIAQLGVKLRPELHVLYASGSAVTDEMSALFVERGRFLRKPYIQEQLYESLGSILGQ